MIGITTYNRNEILDKFAESFNQIDDIDNAYICIFDDNSDEYNEDYIRKIFKKVDYIHINKKTLVLIGIYNNFINISLTVTVTGF